uniref:Activating signal cointegrator 1 n=1 Tax=Acanthochromis polyacanthus TaxID=80966 RepID=A0A3Q1I3F0_9TELE
MSEALLQWCVDQLHHKFGLEASEDIVRYILSIEKAEEMEEYVGDLLQGTDGRKGLFIDELLSRWKKTQRQATDNGNMTKDTQKKSKRKGRNKQEMMTMSPTEPEPEAVKTPIDLMRAQLLRTILVENSWSCFRYGKVFFLFVFLSFCVSLLFYVSFCNTWSCFYCFLSDFCRCVFPFFRLIFVILCFAFIVVLEYFPRQEARMKAGLEKALQHKDKLLEFDRNSVRRTQVLDDESDYFATDSNQWLSPSEREKLRKQEEELRELRHASRKDRKITLDFAGRQVIDEGNHLTPPELDETLKAMNNDSVSESPMYSEGKGGKQSLGQLVNPNIMHAAPEWVDVGGGESRRRATEQEKRPKEDKGGEERSRLRLQDKELQEMCDGGWCLSMHQPWASLLVKGIKRVEGRTWYTSHRGRLWIAAAAKKPTDQEVAEVEAMYRHIYRKEPRFPKDYPTGCLLGCVNVTDCLPQEQFRQQFPDTCEESASPFVFICTNPQELLVKFPMKGKHKICKSFFFHSLPRGGVGDI